MLSKGSLLHTHRVIASQVDTVRSMFDKVEVTTDSAEIRLTDLFLQSEDLPASMRGVFASTRSDSEELKPRANVAFHFGCGGLPGHSNNKNCLYRPRAVFLTRMATPAVWLLKQDQK